MAVPDVDPSSLLIVTSVTVGVSDDDFEGMVEAIIVDDSVPPWSTEQ